MSWSPLNLYGNPVIPYDSKLELEISSIPDETFKLWEAYQPYKDILFDQLIQAALNHGQQERDKARRVMEAKMMVKGAPDSSCQSDSVVAISEVSTTNKSEENINTAQVAVSSNHHRYSVEFNEMDNHVVMETPEEVIHGDNGNESFQSEVTSQSSSLKALMETRKSRRNVVRKDYKKMHCGEKYSRRKKVAMISASETTGNEIASKEEDGGKVEEIPRKANEMEVNNQPTVSTFVPMTAMLASGPRTLQNVYFEKQVPLVSFPSK